MSFIKTNLPCPSCGGSDPVALNEDGSAWCFSCETRFPDYEVACEGESTSSPLPNTTSDIRTYRNNAMNEAEGNFIGLTDRRISVETAKKYGVKATQQGDKITKHLYPYYVSNEITAYKIRESNKMFSWRGNPQGSGLFGEQLFQAGGKYITLVEGECDAMAAYELLGSKWPVVSIKNGASGAVKDVKNSLEFLESFDNVIINFDNDKQGKEAAIKVARVLSPAKAKILSLTSDFKDANDMLRQRRNQAYVSLWWNAKTYTPSGVLNVSDNEDKFNNREKKDSVPYPWSGLNEKLYGIRQGELVTLTGGTGLGKSSVTRELEHWLLTQTRDNVGVIALEEDWRRTVDGIVSIEANARLYVDQVREKFTQEWRDAKFATLFKGENKDRVWVHAHFGSNDLDEVFSKIRFMIVGCGCKWIVVDHLNMLVSSAAEGDERRSIDNIMTRLRSIVEETGAGMILVCHLRRIEGNRGHENGVTVGLNHLRGSQSIAQLSDCVIALERNQQADDLIEANTTHLRVLKSRYTGDVGMAAHLLYNRDTGRLSEVNVEEEDELTSL